MQRNLTGWQSLTVLLLVFVTGVAVAAPLGWLASRRGWFTAQDGLLSPFVTDYESRTRPLQKYSIQKLAERTYQPSEIVIEDVLATEDAYTSYQFSYTTMGQKMTGQLNIPSSLTEYSQPPKVIVMARGYVPLEIFETGVGTRNSAAFYASNGYVTIAPDFFGYGGSDPESENSWETRFVKPINIIELMETIKTSGVPVNEKTTSKRLPTNQIGLWGHSNGGQVILSVLEILGQPFPTTLWAPVTAPFPYSILFFGDELEDEGKEQRAWLALFERDYDAFDFSISKHLDRLTGPIQIHHGTADEAALKAWSDEFIQKIELENDRRQELTEDATASAETTSLPPVDITYFEYPGADHNLQPGWDQVVRRDVAFFDKLFQLSNIE